MGLRSFLKKLFTCEQGIVFVIKELIAYLYLSYFERNSESRFNRYDVHSPKDIRKCNILPIEDEAIIESRKSDTLASNTSDCLLVYGFTKNNEHVAVKISQFGEQATLWISLRLADGTSYSLPVEKLYNVPRTGEECFAAGGLRLRLLVPMRKWRISYNGMLRSKEEKKDVHIKFSFIWTASSMPFDSKSDIPVQLKAEYLAKQPWRSLFPNPKTMLYSVDSYDQSGCMIGTITINGEESPKMLMFGGRLKTAELPYPNSILTKNTHYSCYMEEGDYFHISEYNLANCKSPYQFGFVVHSNSLEKPFQSVTLIQNEGKGGEIEGTFVRREEKFDFHVDKPLQTLVLEKSDFAGRSLEVNFCEVQMNGDRGNMIILSSTHEDVKDYYSANTTIDENKKSIYRALVYGLGDPGCEDVLQTGGKGSSLARLTSASLEDEPFQFKVPMGVVLSTSAYEHFVKDNEIRKLLKDLRFEEIIYGQEPGDVQKLCQRAVSEISKKLLSHKVEEQLEKKLREAFNEDIGDLLFAVRSSAAGEDSEDMSAAGQMTTFLGVRGLEEINQAIIKCWASQFSYIAVQYKKQNGQELNSPMAVVVQQMVPAETAGVMFTCDPLTGNPEFMTITANYGLGESVVSATAEPDTIVVERNVFGQVKVKSVETGQKATQITLSDGGGVIEKEVSSMDSKDCCLSNEMAEKIAHIGNKMENLFGCPLDIEWATFGEQIYLLQARPITTFDKETETELIHESDAYLRCSTETLSKANVGEVLPGAMTEFGAHYMFRMFDIAMKDHWSRKDPKNEVTPYNPYLQKGLITASKHVFLTILDGLMRFEDEKSPKKVFTIVYEIALFGRTLDDEEMRQQAIKRNKNYPTNNQMHKIEMMFYFIRDFFLSSRNMRSTAKIIHDYNLVIPEDLSSQDYYHEILLKMLEITKPGLYHTICTFNSSMYNLWILTTLAKGNGDKFDETVFGDFAILMSSCNQVESADVPNAMKKLASVIAKHVGDSKFTESSVELALEWLKTTQSEAGKQFRSFLQKHGHRCVKEFDVYSKPWGTEPESLVKTLQGMVRAGIEPEGKKSEISTNELLNKLKVQLNWKRRLLLRILVPFCQRAVGSREQSKSVVIRLVDHFRQKFSVLADKMVAEGRLPERDLFFFLSLYEISLLLKTRSAKLIQKAIRRKNMHKEIDSLRFPEILKGLPIPLNKLTAPQVTEGSLCLKGTPVSQGVVTGRVRVATNVEEASLIQPGEILIAYSTDIGWSPYFPMLTGVATELGGLVSHGAVVAREYGLPCVVALHGATSLFRSGDMVLLDGNKGILQRIDDDAQ